jgi:hypothetical protein
MDETRPDNWRYVVAEHTFLQRLGALLETTSNGRDVFDIRCFYSEGQRSYPGLNLRGTNSIAAS